MKKRQVFLTLILIASSVFVSAQTNEKRISFELDGGLSLATRTLDGAELDTGAGLEGTIHYRFLSHTGFYAGWGWNSFNAETSFAGSNVGFEETGYVFGLQYKHPIGNWPVSYFARLGGLYNHLELEDEAGELIGDTKHGLGWQVAGGLDIPLSQNWSLTPGFKFNSLSRDLDYQSHRVTLNLDYISLRVGILKKF